jgi:hypothetical protein
MRVVPEVDSRGIFPKLMRETYLMQTKSSEHRDPRHSEIEPLMRVEPPQLHRPSATSCSQILTGHETSVGPPPRLRRSGAASFAWLAEPKLTPRLKLA